MIDETAIRQRYEALRAGLDERGRRLFAAAEARAAGFGGVTAVARATGIARSTIDRGLRDLAASVVAQNIRRAGGGRLPLTRKDPTLLEDLRSFLEPATLGDPMRPLLWVSKSHAKLAAALRDMGHRVSASRIPQLLERLGYRRQVNRKSKEGGRHPDRDAQFEHINAQVEAHQAAGQPVISVDTKKKELIGEYKNAGSDYRPQGAPIDVDVHDFDSTRNSARPFPTASTTSARTPVASASASITTPPNSRSTPSGAGRGDGTRELPALRSAYDHGGRRRLQRLTRAAVENRTAKTRRRDRTDHQRLPLSARHVEVEQDRASPVLSHHAKLAGASL